VGCVSLRQSFRRGRGTIGGSCSIDNSRPTVSGSRPRPIHDSSREWSNTGHVPINDGHHQCCELGLQLPDLLSEVRSLMNWDLYY
jgi:hypothetical protein